MPGTTQKLLVALFRIERDRLAAWGTWREVKDEKKIGPLKYFGFLFFFSFFLFFFFFLTKWQDLSVEENRINIVKIILKLKLDKQKVGGHRKDLKVSKPDIIHARILRKLL